MKDSLKKSILKVFAFYVSHQVRTQTRILSFDNGRKRCENRLREASKKLKTPVLNYHISSDKIQILVKAGAEQVTELLRYISSTTAADHASRSGWEGPFWKNRYNAVLIQHGIHLLRCGLTMDMTMVSQEKCLYPGQWIFSGYREIIEARKRYRIINRDKTADLSGFENYHAMKAWYIEHIGKIPETMLLENDDLQNALAIGDRENLEPIAQCFPRRISEIRIITDDKYGLTHGLFVPRKTKYRFTRSLKIMSKKNQA